MRDVLLRLRADEAAIFHLDSVLADLRPGDKCAVENVGACRRLPRCWRCQPQQLPSLPELPIPADTRSCACSPPLCCPAGTRSSPRSAWRARPSEEPASRLRPTGRTSAAAVERCCGLPLASLLM